MFVSSCNILVKTSTLVKPLRFQVLFLHISLYFTILVSSFLLAMYPVWDTPRAWNTSFLQSILDGCFFLRIWIKNGNTLILVLFLWKLGMRLLQRLVDFFIYSLSANQGGRSLVDSGTRMFRRLMKLELAATFSLTDLGKRPACKKSFKDHKIARFVLGM